MQSKFRGSEKGEVLDRSSSLEGIVLQGVRSWQEGEGEFFVEGDIFISRGYQKVIWNVFNFMNIRRIKYFVCLGGDDIIFDGGLVKVLVEFRRMYKIFFSQNLGK